MELRAINNFKALNTFVYSLDFLRNDSLLTKDNGKELLDTWSLNYTIQFEAGGLIMTAIYDSVTGIYRRNVINNNLMIKT